MLQILCVCTQALQSCLTLCDPTHCSPPGSSDHGILQAGKNTEMCCHALLQGFFLTQGSNPHLLCLLHWHVGSLSPGKPKPCVSYLTITDIFSGYKSFSTKNTTSILGVSAIFPSSSEKISVCLHFREGNGDRSGRVTWVL